MLTSVLGNPTCNLANGNPVSLQLQLGQLAILLDGCNATALNDSARLVQRSSLGSAGSILQMSLCQRAACHCIIADLLNNHMTCFSDLLYSFMVPSILSSQLEISPRANFTSELSFWYLKLFDVSPMFVTMNTDH